MFLIWVSKSPSQKFSYKFFFLIKNAQISFLISSAEFCPLNTELFNVWKSQFPSIWLRMIWNISVSEVKFLYFLLVHSIALMILQELISKSEIVHQCSYCWFDRAGLLLILAIWSLRWAWSWEFSSSGVLMCWNRCNSSCYDFWRRQSLPPHRSLFRSASFAKMVVGVSFFNTLECMVSIQLGLCC